MSSDPIPQPLPVDLPAPLAVAQAYDLEPGIPDCRENPEEACPWENIRLDFCGLE